MNIIFDFDGTLFDTRTVDVVAFNRARVELGLPAITENEILAAIGKPLSAIAADYFPNNAQLAQQFFNLILQYELEEIPPCAQLFPQVAELLHGLKNAAHNLAICSNGSKEYIEAILKKFDIDDLFDIVWYAHEGVSKTEALKILIKDLPNGKTIYVGDRAEDREAAQSHHLCFIGAAYGYGGSEMDDAALLAQNANEISVLIEGIEVVAYAHLLANMS